MTPLQLRLKGFAGIKAGLGLDEVVLDLRQLPSDARLVAIAGPNGIGKSTLLDNLHPYRVMPSRANGDSPGGFSFYEHLSRSEAVKELLWSLDGHAYRSELVFRVNGKRKTDAFLHVEQNGKWVPVRCPDGTVSDGKIETYDACLHHLLGSAETFFASQFAAQGRRALSDYRPGEIKTLLADMLGEEAILRTGERAAETAHMLKSGLASLRVERRSAESVLEGLAQRRAALGDVDAALTLALNQRAGARAAVDVSRQALERLRSERDALVRTEERRDELLRSIGKLDEAHAQTMRLLDEQVCREQQRLANLLSVVERRRTAASAKLRELSGRRQQLDDAAALRGSVERAARRLPLRDRVAGVRAERCARIEHGLAAARADVEALRACRAEIASLEREAGQAALRVQDLKKRLGLADRVPCAGTELQDRCHLLRDTHEARSLMPSVEPALRAVLGRIEGVRQRQRALAGAPGALQAAEARERRARWQLKRSEERARNAAVLAARLDEVRQAVQLLASVNEEMRDCESALCCGPGEEEQLAQHEANQLLARLEQDRAAAEAHYRRERSALEREIAALPPKFDDGRLDAAAEELRRHEEQLSRAEAGYEAAVRRRQQALDLDEQVESRRAQMAALDACIKHVEAELAGWGLLARALSSGGVIALAIDDAGPALASLANSLLLGCYGPRFTVSIQTQVTTSKGELREGFDVLVHDGDTGEAKSVRYMSGGERVWINECLTRAIALYVAQSSGGAHETLFSDETDGALDSERKRMFMAMKRQVLAVGGYRREFFVSQTPELTAMADAVIDVRSLRSCQTSPSVPYGEDPCVDGAPP